MNKVVISFRWECPCEANETVGLELHISRAMAGQRQVLTETVMDALDMFLEGVAEHEAEAAIPKWLGDVAGGDRDMAERL